MFKTDMFDNPRNRIALDEHILEMSQEFLSRTTMQKIGIASKKYLTSIILPNIVGGVYGYTSGGWTEALEVMKQVSISFVPLQLAVDSIENYAQLIQLPKNHINRLMEYFKKEAINSLEMVENRSRRVGQAFRHINMTYAPYVIGALIAKYLLDIEFDATLTIGAAAIVGIAKTAVQEYKNSGLRDEILKRSKNVSLAKHNGKPLALDDLGRIMDYAFLNKKLVNAIYVASSEKSFRGIGGALGFLGAIDSLNDQNRDPTRIRPEFTLQVKESSSPEEHIEFSFNAYTEKPRQAAIIDLLRTIYKNSKNIDLSVRPHFINTELSELLSEPLQNINMISVEGKSDQRKLFEIQYNMKIGQVEAQIYSRQGLQFVLHAFEAVNERKLTEADLDKELVDAVNGSEWKFYHLESSRPIQFSRRFSKKSLEASEAPDAPEFEDLGILKKIYEQALAKVKDMENAHVGIASQGILYHIQPATHTKKSTIAYALNAVLTPIASLKHLLQDRAIMPDISKLEVIAQLKGIDHTNIPEVTKEIASRIPYATVKAYCSSFSYDDFMNLEHDPDSILRNSFQVCIDDKRGNSITISPNSINYSFSHIRDELCPDNLTLNKAIKDLEDAIAKKDYSKDTSAIHRLRRMRDNPQYEKIDDNHSVLYDFNEMLAFYRDRNVSITTNREIFLERPEFLQSSLKRLAGYLATVKEIADKR